MTLQLRAPDERLGHNVNSRYECASLIALWLLIHGGDPPPQTSSELGTVVGQIIARLSSFAFGESSEVSPDIAQEQLAKLNIQIKVGDGRSRDPGEPMMLLQKPGDRDPYLVYYLPDGVGNASALAARRALFAFFVRVSPARADVRVRQSAPL
jgi:hypothetical protein